MSTTYKVLLILTVIFSVNCKEVVKTLDNENKIVDKVIATMPVLAAYKHSKAANVETAKDFPSLLVLAPDNAINEKVEKGIYTTENMNNADAEIHPIYYVKKLDKNDQYRKRRRRTSTLLYRHRP